jgi:hypothetical protein
MHIKAQKFASPMQRREDAKQTLGIRSSKRQCILVFTTTATAALLIHTHVKKVLAREGHCAYIKNFPRGHVASEE